jgi:hypothetical protein
MTPSLHLADRAATAHLIVTIDVRWNEFTVLSALGTLRPFDNSLPQHPDSLCAIFDSTRMTLVSTSRPET